MPVSFFVHMPPSSSKRSASPEPPRGWPEQPLQWPRKQAPRSCQKPRPPQTAHCQSWRPQNCQSRWGRAWAPSGRGGPATK
eukprot:11897547-Alexandrium_andersonii.AAC.1